ncbi:hypothetical protein AX16_009678 [Volvariella volvacea WC 439]|nr:hypothetical protein AX16_009678 [Volvariella volvacea WC 439]
MPTIFSAFPLTALVVMLLIPPNLRAAAMPIPDSKFSVSPVLHTLASRVELAPADGVYPRFAAVTEGCPELHESARHIENLPSPSAWNDESTKQLHYYAACYFNKLKLHSTSNTDPALLDALRNLTRRLLEVINDRIEAIPVLKDLLGDLPFQLKCFLEKTLDLVIDTVKALGIPL